MNRVLGHVWLATLALAVVACSAGARQPNAGLYREAGVLEQSSLEATQAGALKRAAGLESQALEIYRRVDATEQMVAALNRLGRLRMGLGDLAAADRDFREAYELSEVTKYSAGQAAAANNLGSLARVAGDSDLAVARFTEAIEAGGATSATRASGLNNRALLLFARGDSIGARQDLMAALALDRASGNRTGEALRRRNLATIDLREGALDDAIAQLTQARALNIGEQNTAAIARDLELVSRARWLQGGGRRQALSERRRSYEMDRLQGAELEAGRQRTAIEGWCTQWPEESRPVDCIFVEEAQ